MILLFNHVSSFQYRAVEQTGVGRELDEDARAGETDEALLVKLSTERGDDEETVSRAVEEITDVATQLGGTDTVVLFPWAHLTEDLAAPETAQELLDLLTREVDAAGFESLSAPFGWYKEWELHSKGHPLSVLRRSVQ